MSLCIEVCGRVVILKLFLISCIMVEMEEMVCMCGLIIFYFWYSCSIFWCGCELCWKVMRLCVVSLFRVWEWVLKCL